MFKSSLTMAARTRELIVEDSTILAIWGRARIGFCYKGCDRELEDGRSCPLGVVARRAGQPREEIWKPFSQNRAMHIYRQVREGVPMFCFTIQNETKIRDVLGWECCIKLRTKKNWVWDEGGQQPFGMNGDTFQQNFTRRQEVEEFCKEIMAGR